jgi:hypothetical protein
MLATSQDATQLKKRGLKERVDDVAGNTGQALRAVAAPTGFQIGPTLKLRALNRTHVQTGRLASIFESVEFGFWKVPG